MNSVHESMYLLSFAELFMIFAFRFGFKLVWRSKRNDTPDTFYGVYSIETHSQSKSKKKEKK